MKIVLINPPHTAIGSRVPDDHLPPLGLLALGGPLLDAGHEVRLVDAEFGPMPLPALVEDALGDGPDCILIGLPAPPRRIRPRCKSRAWSRAARRRRW